MIHVKLFYQNEYITSFEISGHAESGPYGYDLVCAGVSAISFGAINAIISLCDIELQIEQEDDGGYLHVTVPQEISEVKREKMQLLLDGMIVSLETIERDYSKYISISKT